MAQIYNEKPWLKQYPAGVPEFVDDESAKWQSLTHLLESCFKQYASSTAFTMMGKNMSYAELDKYSLQLATYLQQIGLKKGDRVAVMMPNVLQYPIAVSAILRAGLILVNVNPLYTARELEHQLQDSGARAVIILENFASTLEHCIAHTQVEHVILASMGDMMGFKGAIVNLVVRHVKKMVPAFHLPKAVSFKHALNAYPVSQFNKPDITLEDVAVLQYTGGTTGVAKGAVLLHRNVVANVCQAEAWFKPGIESKPLHHQLGFVCALPLYHIFAFTVNMMLGAKLGGKNILLPNPRDLPSVIKELKNHTFHAFPGVNTLFNGLAHHSDFDQVDWSHLRITVGGGMAVQQVVAKLWLERTGCPICEGYGLSETSPIASCNPVINKEFTGTIGIPLPGTMMKLVDEDGHDVSVLGERGEIAIKGPQVMAGYWQRADETARVMTADGYFCSGDIGVMNEKGYFTIVDRKKDMILVSGFNVYPNEVEEVVASTPGVLECAVVGIPDENSGEAVRLYVVRKPGSNVTEKDIRRHCHDELTGYKRPRSIEFRDSLPKTPVGKILRRELRDEALKEMAARSTH